MTARPHALTSGKLWVFRAVAALGVPLALFALLEAGLRFGGFGYPTGFTRPCLVRGVESRCDNPSFTWQFFPRKT